MPNSLYPAGFAERAKAAMPTRIAVLLTQILACACSCGALRAELRMRRYRLLEQRRAWPAECEADGEGMR